MFQENHIIIYYIVLVDSQRSRRIAAEFGNEGEVIFTVHIKPISGVIMWAYMDVYMLVYSTCTVVHSVCKLCHIFSTFMLGSIGQRTLALHVLMLVSKPALSCSNFEYSCNMFWFLVLQSGV